MLMSAESDDPGIPQGLVPKNDKAGTVDQRRLHYNSLLSRTHFESIGLEDFLDDVQSVLQPLEGFEDLHLEFGVTRLVANRTELLPYASFRWQRTKSDTAEIGWAVVVLYHPNQHSIVISGRSPEVLPVAKINQVKDRIAASLFQPQLGMRLRNNAPRKSSGS